MTPLLDIKVPQVLRMNIKILSLSPLKTCHETVVKRLKVVPLMSSLQKDGNP